MPRRRWVWHGFPGGRSSSSPTRSAASGGTRCAGSSRSPRGRSGRGFAALFERYANESPPRGSKADLDDAAGFVAAICRWADPVEPVWAVDLARYELAWRQAARAGRVPLVRMFRFPVAQAGDRPGAGARRCRGRPSPAGGDRPGGEPSGTSSSRCRGWVSFGGRTRRVGRPSRRRARLQHPEGLQIDVSSSRIEPESVRGTLGQSALDRRARLRSRSRRCRALQPERIQPLELPTFTRTTIAGKPSLHPTTSPSRARLSHAFSVDRARRRPPTSDPPAASRAGHRPRSRSGGCG